LSQHPVFILSVYRFNKIKSSITVNKSADNDLNAYPVINGRASKKINHLNIDPTKTWKDNGFVLVAIP
jgi:hypothetical protein